MQELARSFIPVADEVYSLHMGQGVEAKFFQAIARQGHAGLRNGVTQQGTYCFAASGEFLGSDNTRDPERLMRLLRAALKRWEALPQERKVPARGKEMPRPVRGEQFYPKEGLVLRQYSRDIGPGKRTLGDYENPWNTDLVWFSAAELKQMLPTSLTKGSRREVPAMLVSRLARLHMIDHVLGQGMPFQPQQIVSAQMTMEVSEPGDDRVVLRITGETKAGDMKRGIETRLLGKATYVPSKSQFTAFEMLAVGTRRGMTFKAPYVGNDTGSGGIGYAFILASDSPVDRVAPSGFGAYGWQR